MTAFLMLLVVGCEQPGPIVDTTVSDARLRDEAHTFLEQDDGFAVTSSKRGLGGYFAAEGARLRVGEDDIGVQTVTFGRDDAVAATDSFAPTLGECQGDLRDPSGECVQRLEYVSSSLTEWWTTLDYGFEQGFTVEAPPPGEGDLAIDVAVDGADVLIHEENLTLKGDGGGLVAVSGLSARDADGEALGAWFEDAGAGFRIRVEDTGARYPVEIDPVYATAAATLMGEEISRFGASVSAAGDVNGDGNDDVIVGAYRYGSYTGRAYLYAGSESGLESSALTILTGETTNDFFGRSVSDAGDVNGDGRDDVIVGAPGDEVTKTGRAYLFEGSASGLSTTAAATLTGEAAGNAFGQVVSYAGDVDGDGYDDVIIGAYKWGTSPGHWIGRAYLYEGSASGLSISPSTTLTGLGADDQFGWAVSRPRPSARQPSQEVA